MFRIKGKKLLIFVAIIWGVFFLDVVSKFLTVRYIPNIAEGYFSFPYGGRGVFRDFLGVDFSIVYLQNTGGAWGIFRNFSNALFGLRCVFVAVLVVYLLFFSKTRTYDYPLALVIGGAVGNILDFALYGHVVDMLNFRFWNYDYPVFNIADMAIFVGMVWLVILSFGNRKK